MAPLMRAPVSMRLMVMDTPEWFELLEFGRHEPAAETSAAQMLALFVDDSGARAGAAIAEHRSRQIVQRVDHAGHRVRIDAHAPDRHMLDFKAEFPGAGGDVGKAGLPRLLLIRPVADDRLETHLLDPVEILAGELARAGVFIVDLAHVHDCSSGCTLPPHYAATGGASIDASGEREPQRVIHASSRQQLLEFAILGKLIPACPAMRNRLDTEHMRRRLLVAPHLQPGK